MIAIVGTAASFIVGQGLYLYNLTTIGGAPARAYLSLLPSILFHGSLLTFFIALYRRQ
jgi:hypothetical protein